jgi:Flp pilus assembly protein TadG
MPRMTRCVKGTAAVEFAMVVPILIVMLFGIITFGAYLAVIHGVQQLAAEAARAAMGGLDDTERAGLATQNVTANVAAYPLLTPARMHVGAVTDAATQTFTVTLNYDASNLWIYALPALVPAPNPLIVRSAAIQRGGY